MFVNDGAAQVRAEHLDRRWLHLHRGRRDDRRDHADRRVPDHRVVDGLVVDSLGSLWRPRFFDEGFAIHGDSYVPPVPVSHGCVRVSNEAIDWIWANNLDPIGTEVWVY